MVTALVSECVSFGIVFLPFFPWHSKTVAIKGYLNFMQQCRSGWDKRFVVSNASRNILEIL